MSSVSQVSTSKQQEKKVDAKILDRKNIQKRLEGLKSDEYQKIKNNLTKQNDKLKIQVSTLSQKVNLLLKTKNFNTTIKKNTQVESQILNLKKQLQTRYETMNQLKQQIRKQTQTNMTEQMKQRLKVNRNQVRAIQVQLQQLNLQKKKVQKQFAQNQISMVDYTPSQEFLDKLQMMKFQNKELKRKVHQKVGFLKQKQKQSQQAINKIYNLKSEGISKNRVKSLAILNKAHHQKSNSQTNLTQQQKLQKQIQKLKMNKRQMEKELDGDKTQKELKKAQLQKQIRQRLQYQKQIFTKRVKQQSHLNYLIKKEEEYKLDLERKLNIKIEKIDDVTQTELTILKNYRKEWIGKSQGIVYDDSNLFQPKQLSIIKSLTIYKTPTHIVCIKVGYETNTRRRLQSIIPLERQALKKIEKIQSKKLTSKGNGYLKGIVVSLTNKIITKIETKWSDGDTSVQGWEQDQSIKYQFDIAQNQRPVIFYGSIVPYGNSYNVQSIGFQIATI